MRYPRLAAAVAVTGSMFMSAQLQADTYLSIGSNPVGNTAYQWAAGISEVVNKNVEGVNAAAEGTKGYVANVQLMLDGKVEAGFSNTKLAYEAHHAEGDYAGQKPGQIVGWMSIKPIIMHVIVMEDSDIKSVTDLKGKRVGMGHRLQHNATKLSGGERQRVAVARALINDPPLIMADEPTGNLDEATGEAVMGLLLELVNEADKSLILVTHNPEFAACTQRQLTLHLGCLRST